MKSTSDKFWTRKKSAAVPAERPGSQMTGRGMPDCALLLKNDSNLLSFLYIPFDWIKIIQSARMGSKAPMRKK
jgi:hypothetical protein